jgi:drug/metabolite transporter (DMT)-like permease
LTTTVLLLALASALLHATWNAAARATPDPATTLRAVVICAGLWMLPVVVWLGLPHPEAWPWMLASSFVNILSVMAMGRAYATTDFTIAYPLTRGLSPIIVMLGGGLIFADWPAASGILGVLALSCGLFLLVLVARGRKADRTGLLWTVTAALLVGLTILCDARGVRVAGEPIAYMAFVSTMNGAIFAAMSLAAGGGPVFRFIRERPFFAFGWTLVSNFSYAFLVLALVIGPAALAAALRETSMLFATFIAAVLYKEKVLPLHWMAVGLAAAGAMLMRFG